MKKLILNKETYYKIEAYVREYMLDTKVRSVFILNTAGLVLFQQGIKKNDHFIQSIGALTAGIFNATSSLAKLLGDDYFLTMFQEGKQLSFFYSIMENDYIFLTLYDKNAIIGVVNAMTKKIVKNIESLMIEEETTETSVASKEFKEELEDLIDNLFE